MKLNSSAIDEFTNIFAAAKAKEFLTLKDFELNKKKVKINLGLEILNKMGIKPK